MQQELLSLPEHTISSLDFCRVHVVQFVQLHVSSYLVTCCDGFYDFRGKKWCQSIRLHSHLFCSGFVFYLCYLYFYVYWCTTPFPYQMMFLLFTLNLTGTTSGAGVAYFGVGTIRIAEFLVFCVVFCWASFVFNSCTSTFEHCIPGVVCPSIYCFVFPIFVSSNSTYPTYVVLTG